MKQLMFLVLFLLCSTVSFAQEQKENIFSRITANNPVSQKAKIVDPSTDVSTITIISTSHNSKKIVREVLVRLKVDDNICYHIIDMNAKTDQDFFDANKYFVLANLGYDVPELKGKCWGTIKLKGIDYIALFNRIN